MRTCKVCNKSYRTGRIAFVMTDKGLKGARVCQGCATDGVLLVAANQGQRCSCGKPAVRCTACSGKDEIGAKKATAGVDGAIKRLRGLIKGLTDEPLGPSLRGEARAFVDGRVEGLESAIRLLESGRW